jgi:hypothetical protein
MCSSSPKPPPPPPPPAPPPPVPIPELDKELTRDKLAGGQNKGRRKLRIDMTGGTSGSEGSGLNIPT